MLKNVIYFAGSLLLFFAGIIVYGIILNLREVALEDILAERGIQELDNVKLIVDKSSYSINLYSDSLLIKSYKAVFGKNRKNIKSSLFDNVTPAGKFIICRKDSSAEYHKFLKLNFPNEDFLASQLMSGYISESEYQEFLRAVKSGNCDEYLPAGEIGIHGIGEYDIIFRNLPFIFNWTNGSVAVSNKNMDELYSVTAVGTEVLIRE